MLRFCRNNGASRANKPRRNRQHLVQKCLHRWDSAMVSCGTTAGHKGMRLSPWPWLELTLSITAHTIVFSIHVGQKNIVNNMFQKIPNQINVLTHILSLSQSHSIDSSTHSLDEYFLGNTKPNDFRNEQ